MIPLIITVGTILVVGGILWLILTVARSLIKFVVVVLVLLVLALFFARTFNLMGDEIAQWKKEWKKE